MANLDDLYFVRAKNGPVKIGRSQNVPERLRNIRTSCPVEVSCILTLPGKGWQEKIWHEALAEYRQRGEWFDYAAEVRQLRQVTRSRPLRSSPPLPSTNPTGVP